ncbi:hypothetical protein LN040_16615 [Desulfovibrio subterraneus]|uniref:hypothetical protein n=1 Tax=Desulfovibrio subterraneus TaxID=2718620 RepID=UPI0022B8E7FA|nr:hypothetical protein [Desulfovibrio subterraneus]WBF67311.1 hypothetical protein LN040_16615 [Desulfovibrio subterraneus]
MAGHCKHVCLLLLACLLLLTGCGTRTPEGGMAGNGSVVSKPVVPPSVADSVADSSLRYAIDSALLWRTCAARCMQDDEYGILTRKGCLTGCEMARKARPNKGMTYGDIAWCVQDIERLNVTEHVKPLEKQCRENWKHLYKRRGCRDAVKAYYADWNTGLCVVDVERARDLSAEEEPLIATKRTKKNAPVKPATFSKTKE